MTITLTSGSTVQTLCDGPGFAGQTGKMIGPVGDMPLGFAWDVQVKRPIRATAATPLPRENRTLSVSFSVYQVFATIEAARLWAVYTWPNGVLRAGTLKLYVNATNYAAYANAALQQMPIVQHGVAVDVSFVFVAGALTYA